MIIAWSLFLIGAFATIIHILHFALHSKEIEKDGKFEKIRNNMWIYFIITICSAQYIWG